MRLLASLVLVIVAGPASGDIPFPDQGGGGGGICNQAGSYALIPAAFAADVQGSEWETKCDDLIDGHLTQLSAKGVAAAAGEFWGYTQIGTLSFETVEYGDGEIEASVGLGANTGPFLIANGPGAGWSIQHSATVTDSFILFDFESGANFGTSYFAVGVTDGTSSHFDTATDERYEPPNAVFVEMDADTAAVQSWRSSNLRGTSNTLSLAQNTRVSVALRFHYDTTAANQWVEIYVDGVYFDRLTDPVYQMIANTVLRPFFTSFELASSIKIKGICRGVKVR